ncbi:MAG: tryptophan--tRNA ligase, partial [Alistipes sp.]|nr:tryptophan--tRNA ligase [Alistipes sp.]
FVLDEPGTVVKKFKSAVTDSDMEIAYREGKDGINNLMSIYSAVTGLTLEQIEADFAGKGYGDFKQAVGEAVAEELRPVRERYNELMKDKAYLEASYRAGADKALHFSQRTLDKVYKKIGFLPY